MRSVKVASLWESVVNAMHFSPFFHSHPVFLTSFRYRIFHMHVEISRIISKYLI